MKKTRSVKKSTDVINRETGSRLLPTRSTILTYGTLLNIKMPKIKITHGRHVETAWMLSVVLRYESNNISDAAVPPASVDGSPVKYLLRLLPELLLFVDSNSNLANLIAALKV